MASVSEDAAPTKEKQNHISWLKEAPKQAKRRRVIETIARELGEFGYVHVWINGHDSRTVLGVINSKGQQHYVRENRISAYAGKQPGHATMEGEVYFVVENGKARIMKDYERAGEETKALELNPVQCTRDWEVIQLPA
ncbi:hypothetical protein PT974_00343 [Cladobotryum mycophilum]|uniref:Uncharacterized protein n=1 Tax=Cladobotryum mycophilum TaxID=491253 RepID=A0ABR0T0L8_9HYPO